MKKIYMFLKRVFDVLISIFVLVSSFPLLVIVSILIKMTSEGDVIYRHRRIGKNGKIINVLKFRTMVNNIPLEDVLTKEQLEEYKKNFKISNDPRVTKIGKIITMISSVFGIAVVALPSAIITAGYMNEIHNID